jgi:hypothetical protein
MKICACGHGWKASPDPAPIIGGRRCWLCWKRLKRLAYKLDPTAYHRYKFGAALPEHVIEEVKNRDADFLRQRQPLQMLKMSGLKYAVAHRGTPQMVVFFRDRTKVWVDLYISPDAPGLVMYKTIGDSNQGLRPIQIETFIHWYKGMLKNSP